MAVYDMSGLADWVAANSVSVSGPQEEGIGKRFGSGDMPERVRGKRVILSSTHQAGPSDTGNKLWDKRVIPSSSAAAAMNTAPAHHKHHSAPRAPLLSTPKVKKAVRFTESVRERDESRGEGRKGHGMKGNGKSIKRLVCEGCGGRSVGGEGGGGRSVSGEGYCEGCLGEERKRRGRR